MSKEKHDKLLGEMWSCVGNYGNERRTRELMQIECLDRIAGSLENIDQSLRSLTACTGPAEEDTPQD